MRRVSLSDLSADPAVDLRTTATPAPSTPPPQLRKSGSSEVRTSAVRWDQFERKETRLRADQVEALTVLARRLNKQRSGPGPRITENTLIRVAVDMLLECRDELAGEDEAALRAGVARTQS